MLRKSVDIIIPTLKPEEDFVTLLASLAMQTVKPNRIIIMDTIADSGISCEQYAEKANVSDITTVVHLPKAEFNHGMTRNKAVELSDSEYFICMTQDALPCDDKLIERLIAVMDDKIKMSYARQIAKDDACEIEKITREFNYPTVSKIKTEDDKQNLGIKTYFASNVCAAYERETFEKLGGFVKTDFNEDMIYAGTLLQAGYSLAYAADACVKHSHNLNGIMQYRRNKDIARSQSEHPEIFGGVKSESEGIRLVKTTIAELARKNKIYLVPKLIWQSGCKYLGFRAGRK